MLSAHEIAALMVLDSLGSCVGLDPRDLAALANRQLIDLRQQQPSGALIELTREGRHMLDAVAGTQFRPEHFPVQVKVRPSGRP